MGETERPQVRPADRGPAWALAVARVRVVLPVLGILLVVLDAFLPGPGWLVAGLALLAAGVAAYLVLGRVHAEPVDLAFPLDGRWVAVNSPAGKVPSHGLHAYGQTYAVDLIHVPEGDWSTTYGWGGPHTPDPETFAGWGRPVRSPADGVVVGVRGGQRDHGARTSYPAVLLMVLEGFLLELTGRILGNHVVLEIAPSTYVALAHLRRGSVRVAVGDTVRAGDLLGECGNSGNTSEPHVHLQVMDRRRAWLAAGLPFRFVDAVADDGTDVDVPAERTAARARTPRG